jgi:diadenosine tetraphosphatase ApaH/serine/threonine PP2A family protein phosphatase
MSQLREYLVHCAKFKITHEQWDHPNIAICTYQWQILESGSCEDDVWKKFVEKCKTKIPSTREFHIIVGSDLLLWMSMLTDIIRISYQTDDSSIPTVECEMTQVRILA